MAGVAYAVLGACLLGRLMPRAERPEDRGVADGMPCLTVLALGVGWAAYRADPLARLGLGLSELAACPWGQMAIVWAAALVCNRVAARRVFRPDLARLLGEGKVNPGGTYLALSREGFSRAAVLGLAMTGSQAFFEEYVFRGLLMAGAFDMAKLAGICADGAALCAAAATSALFGLAHFAPARMAAGLRGRSISLYALIMPSALAAIFCAMNASARSLWPGWLVHWCLNYSGFAWDRLFEHWERLRPSRAREARPDAPRDAGT